MLTTNQPLQIFNFPMNTVGKELGFMRMQVDDVIAHRFPFLKSQVRVRVTGCCYPVAMIHNATDPMPNSITTFSFGHSFKFL